MPQAIIKYRNANEQKQHFVSHAGRGARQGQFHIMFEKPQDLMPLLFNYIIYYETDRKGWGSGEGMWVVDSGYHGP